MAVILRRDDFVKLSDGSTMFGHVLSALGIAEEHQAQVHEVSVEIGKNTPFKMHNEDGKRLVRKTDLNTNTTTIEALD